MSITNQMEVRFRFNKRDYASPSRGFQAFGAKLQKDYDGGVTAIKADLVAFLNHVADLLIARNSRAYPGGTTDDSISVRTGAALKELKESVRVIGNSLSTMQGSIRLSGQLAIHEYGGTIKAKDKMLTIPLPAATDSRGVPLVRSARQWKNTFVARSRAGNLIIFQKRGARLVPLYLLRDSITIKPRLHVRDTFKSQIPYFMEKATDDLVRKLVEG